MLIADFSFLKQDRKYKERGGKGKKTKSTVPFKGFLPICKYPARHRCQGP